MINGFKVYLKMAGPEGNISEKSNLCSSTRIQTRRPTQTQQTSPRKWREIKKFPPFLVAAEPSCKRHA